MHRPSFSGMAEHQVHILYRLSCCAFDQVVHRTHHDDSFRSRIDLEVDIHIVASLDPFRLRADILIENTYKLLVGIILYRKRL